ncbi:MAG: ABC transporter ATP-binding protein [Rubinisphaera brasiliensis]|uniref:Xenobiotic-transporting ATPase n=1 Tax=Rubinisphaera brasiliensis (strain ATCC 49424 / DSM 5305 / JCM 21570 / IAM 15109 / NBRC 103401 / IFAM 1448) TaxID=756272 RepID=F0SFU0_RUBBR|nr:ABC transporter ATP-binding protein [Rubinisphaera brasiliensis]ADY61547.1 Xenobiotic-transporting ATPase [Rubinisphaera brasiliensis DSM 5305]
MSIIDGFQKIWPFVSRYKRLVVSSFVLAVLVGVLWGANLSLVFPVSNVLMQGNLQDYVATQIQDASAEIQAKESLIADIDEEIGSGELAESQRVRRLETRTEHVEQIALASHRLHWLEWTQAKIMPWIPEDQFNTVALFFGILFVATAIKGLFIFGQNMIVGSLVELVTIDVRKACLRKCLKLDYQTLSLEGTPTLMSRFTFDIQEMAGGLALLGGKMAREPFKAIACVSLAFMVNWRLTLLSMIFVPIMGYIFYRFGKLLKQASHRMMDSMSRIYHVLEETFNSMRVVIAFGNGRRHRQNFHEQNKKYYEKAMKIRTIDALTHPTVELMGIGAIFVTVLPCMYLLLRKTTTIGGIQLADTPPDVSTLILLYTFLVGTLDPVRKLSTIYSKLKRSVVAISRIDDFLNRDTLVVETENQRLLPRHHKQIEFQDVRFAYATKENRPRPDALRDVSLKIQHGECVVVVGENGSGKSTLVNLLPRYYDPDHGKVLIDDVDIQDVSLKTLRSQLGVVTQETMLFNATIYENIRYGNPQATRSEIEDAAVQAGVTQFIDQLPDGFDTMIGEKGAGLSGGQRQRIALARALVRQPSILILDEATSAIDSQSEYHIQQALKRYVGSCTTFIITHAVNRSLLDVATRIVVMHEGRLLAHGRHDQLIDTCPIYSNLYQAQVKQRAA